MKFKHNKHFDTKPWKVKFAWFPTIIYSSKQGRTFTIWFESYQEKQTYIVKERATKFGYKITCGDWEKYRKFLNE
jgi:hypothetical protein